MRQLLLVIFLCAATLGEAQSQEKYVPTIDTGPAFYRESATLDDLMRRLDAHEAEIRTLRATQSESRDSSLVPPAPSREGEDGCLTSVDKAFGNCVAPEQDDTSSDDDGFDIKIGGRILYDGTWGTDDGLERTLIGETFQNGHQFRRVRLFAEGTGYEVLEYKLQLEFSNGRDGPRLRDVYIGMTETPFGRFRIGHLKEPNSLEKMASSKYNVFLERGLPRPMLQVRGAGFVFFDTYSNDMGTWAVGSFFDDFQQTATSIDGDVDNDDTQGRTVNARLTRLLWYDEPSEGRYLSQIGGSFRWADAEISETLVFRARPEVQDTFRFLGVVVPPTENYYQWGAEAVAVFGPLSVQGEYIVTNFSGPGPSPTIGGAYVFASYFLTGEHRNYDRETAVFDQITPHENFLWIDSCDGCCGEGLGAWEVAARWSYLDFDDTGLVPAGGEDGTRGTLSNFTFGINWYWNPETRLSFNYVHSELNEAITGQTADLDAFLTRFQIEF